MPSKICIGMTTRSKTPTKPLTPSGGVATPRTPASGRGTPRTNKTSSRKKASRGLKRKLSDQLDEDDAGSNDEEPSESPAAAGGGPTPLPVRPEPAPDVPPAIWEQLEASDDPLMKLIGAQFRAAQSREDALRNELASVKEEAAARQAVRDFEKSGLSKFRFDPAVTK